MIGPEQGRARGISDYEELRQDTGQKSGFGLEEIRSKNEAREKIVSLKTEEQANPFDRTRFWRIQGRRHR